MVYDAVFRNTSEKEGLFPVLLGGILFQLRHALGHRRAAHADLFHEKGKDTHSGGYCDIDDCDHYIQAGPGGHRGRGVAVRAGLYGPVSGGDSSVVLSGACAECVLCGLHDGPGVPPGAGGVHPD